MVNALEDVAQSGQVSAVSATAEPSTYDRNKLRIAGLLNGLGDVSLLYGAHQAKKRVKTIAGALYTAGAAAVTFFGTPRRDEQVQDLQERAAEFVQKNSEITSADLESSQILENKETSFFHNAGKHLRRHAGQIMLYFYTAGAGFMLANGVKELKENRAKNDTAASVHDYSGIALGGFSLAVKLAALVMPEKSATEIDNESAPKSLWQDIKAKPLKLFGYGSMLTEAFWGWATYSAKKAGKEWKWDAITGSSYALSDVIIATTHKDAANAVGKLNDVEQGKLEDMLAQTIAGQKTGMQEQLITQSAEFLDKEALVSQRGETLRQSLRQRVEKFRDAKGKTPEGWVAQTAASPQETEFMRIP